jgi:ABC-type branched-subunit amino acid transport system substrate-binding protein
MLQVNGINLKLIRVSATTTPQALVEEIQEYWKMYSTPVFIELPNQPLRHIEAFYRPDSFSILNRLRRDYNTPIIFIIPAGVRLTNEAKRAGFPVYSALSEGVEALAQDASNATLSPSGPLTPHINNQQSSPSFSPVNNTRNVILPSYMSNPPSWSALPQQNFPTPFESKRSPITSPISYPNSIDIKHSPTTSPISYSNSMFDMQQKVEGAISPMHEAGPNYADERANNESSQSAREFGTTTQISSIGKNTPHRPIYKRVAFLVTLVVLIFLLLIGGFLITLQATKTRLTRGTSISTTTALQVSSTRGIGVEKAPDGEYIGLSDGSFAFDTARLDGVTKQQGAEKLRAGDVGTALSLWHDAVTRDTNDAEALIYLEDQRVLSSGNPYVTLVVGTMDTGTYVSLGRDDLQGAYLAQKKYNNGPMLSGKFLVRLLVASTGNDKAYADIVAKQIVQAAKTDPSVVGVMGWPYSSRTLNVVQTLTNAHIPIVSQMASSVLLIGASPYFFRIVPPDSTQAAVGAVFTEKVLHAKSAALFIDPSDAYSESIGSAFKQKFESDGDHVVVTERYTVGKPQTVASTLQDALLHTPDVIYFAGLADDANALLAHLPTQGQFAQIKVVGGDGLFSVGSYSKDPVVQQNFHRLCFSAFAYADTWGFLGSKTQPSFYSDYPATFDPYQQHNGGAYGYDRADGDVILSYDATVVLLDAYQNVLSTRTNINASTRVTPSELRDALASITDTNAIQGVTVRIAFGTNNDPVNKVVVMLAVSPTGLIQLQSVQGRFFK